MSDSYKIKHHGVEECSNTSGNSAFSAVLDARFSRRSVLQAGGAAGVAGLSAGLLPALVQAAPLSAKPAVLGFAPVPFSAEDRVVVPQGYAADVLYAWGDPVGIKGMSPAFKADASNSAAEQAVQAGMHHDGMAYFGLPQGTKTSKHGLLAINHEYTDDGLLHSDGMKSWDGDKVKKAQAANGVSVIEVEDAGKGRGWRVVRPSKYARRITASTPIAIGGPARGHTLMKTEADPLGVEILGTLNNCANGQTPWGTYLTCEENFDGYFVNDSGALSDNEKRYGIKNKDAGYKWAWEDFRFDLQLNPNEANRFGWVVEIDPFDPKSKPVKRTALGRFKHEGATVTIAPDGRAVVYMGDDQRFEYIYKFVSKNRYQPNNRKANSRLLDEGTLYVARFDADGSGQWLPLVHGQNGVDASRGFADQGEVVIKARMAADVVGATKMDRPEWIAINPKVAGEVYCTLTNNSERGGEGKPGVDAANPRADNKFGHIIRWHEAGGNAAANAFKWDIFALAGKPDAVKSEHKGALKGDIFGSADGLSFDQQGVLWVQTDVSTSTANIKEYAGMGNNQMLAVIPETGEFRRFLTGPNGSEITGISFTPDNKTLFINIQHPGEPESERSDPAKPTAISSWPDGAAAGRPRSATVVIRKLDGGVIGS